MYFAIAKAAWDRTCAVMTRPQGRQTHGDVGEDQGALRCDAREEPPRHGERSLLGDQVPTEHRDGIHAWTSIPRVPVPLLGPPKVTGDAGTCSPCPLLWERPLRAPVGTQKLLREPVETEDHSQALREPTDHSKPLWEPKHHLKLCGNQNIISSP